MRGRIQSKRVRHWFRWTDLSTVIAAVLTALSGAALIGIAAASLACPDPRTDQFQRLYKQQPGFCCATNELNKPRQVFMLVLSSLLSLGSTVWLMASARRAYSKFLVNGGVSAVYARMLLREVGALMGAVWWLRRMKQEPGNTSMHRLKLATITATGAVVVIVAVLHIVLGAAYTTMSVRLTTQHTPTTSIPQWLDYSRLQAANWEETATFLNGTVNETPCTGSDIEVTACVSLMSPVYNGVYSHVRYTPNAMPASAKGSGLPVVHTRNKNAAGQENVLAYIVTSGRLLAPIPDNAADFSIHQELVLIQRLCVMSNGMPWSVKELARNMQDEQPQQFWSGLEEALPIHTLPRRQPVLQQAGIIVEGGDAYMRPGVLTAGLGSTTADMVAAAFAPFLTDAPAEPAPGQLEGAGRRGTVREQYYTEHNNTHFRMWAISPDYGLICRTELLPFRAVLRMSTPLTIPLVDAATKERIPFSSAAMRWLNATLAATKHAVTRLEAPFLDTSQTLGGRADGVLPTALDWPRLPTLMNSCYMQNHVASMSYNDSCVSTEVDKVFQAYLHELATLDKRRWDIPPTQPAASPVLTPSGVQNGAISREGFATSAQEPTWDWGPVVARYVPNKTAHAFILLLAFVSMVLLILLHWMTSPFTLRGPLYMVPECIKDAAPWMALADAANPPEALKDASGLTVDQVVHREGAKGIVIGLLPHPAPAGAAAPSPGLSLAPTLTKLVVTVEQGWQLQTQHVPLSQHSQSTSCHVVSALELPAASDNPKSYDSVGDINFDTDDQGVGSPLALPTHGASDKCSSGNCMAPDAADQV